MDLPRTDASAPHTPAELEAAIARIERLLESMGEALQRCDVARFEHCAGELQRALPEAVQMGARAAHHQGLPPALRQRLARASGRVAAQRELFARATMALDRAIEVLIPGGARGACPAAAGTAGCASPRGEARPAPACD